MHNLRFENNFLSYFVDKLPPKSLAALSAQRDARLYQYMRNFRNDGGWFCAAMLKSDHGWRTVQAPHWERHSEMALFTEENECVAKEFKIKSQEWLFKGFFSPALA